LHRDLKPSNIIVSDRDEVKVIDFGISARLASTDPDRTDSSEKSVFLGTPAYMAPEQLLMQPLDERTDVWAIGMLTYEMLVGRLPFRAKTDFFARAGVLSKEDSATWRDVESVSPMAVPCLQRALAWERDSRLGSAHEFASMLCGTREAS
jgi:serine/threonine-protein kinase